MFSPIWLKLLVVCYVLGTINAQTKLLACSYKHPGAREAGYLPEYIPLEECSHVIFKEFRFPKVVGRQMQFHDDDMLAFSSLVSSLRNRSTEVFVVASVRGTQKDFSVTGGVSVRRRAFVQLIGTLLLELDADGVEINWISPETTDRSPMVTLLQDLRQIATSVSRSARGRNRELWFQVWNHVRPISSVYNVPEVCELTDRIMMNAKEYPIGFSHAPIHTKPIDLPTGVNIPSLDYYKNDITDSTQQWIDEGCPPKKLSLSIALYGVQKQYQHVFSFEVPSGVDVNTKYIPYSELCLSYLTNQWTFNWDSYGLMPYATRELGNALFDRVSYDNVHSLRYKMDLVQEKRLGGIHLDYVHYDDIYGRCGQAYPLTSYLASKLRTIPSDISFAIEWSQ
ncbi:endochitinase-like [Anopheles aquasalis]|uniref:endochitinase-like n=1 Tax=Anopheles aquasalis TaxID=42839 RepID=UPI00215ACECD|nr:endochitinase-like [Anopheles aquasalis]